MKKLIASTITALLAATTIYAASNEVYSVNIVGFQKTEILPSGNLVLAACNFETGATNTLLGIFGTNNLVQNNLPSSCDRILLYDVTNQSYTTYAQWTDGQFYPAGTLNEWTTAIKNGTPVDPEVTLGNSLWIKSAPESTTTNIIAFVGDVVESPEVSIPVVEGFQLLSYPFSCSVGINETLLASSGAYAATLPADCDHIYLWSNDGYSRYGLFTDGKWYPANTLTEWRTAITDGNPASNTIETGSGFFYEAQSSFVWTETNKYLTNLNN
ncbi:MAG: hypothetical protein EOL87_06145 [Spartobacteria bacterium]|nr:hypothetical protein [Spartobacteria bacterium]